jgi:hypothetical protein
MSIDVERVARAIAKSQFGPEVTEDYIDQEWHCYWDEATAAIAEIERTHQIIERQSVS